MRLSILLVSVRLTAALLGTITCGGWSASEALHAGEDEIEPGAPAPVGIQTTLAAGDLRIALERTEGGVQFRSLFDARAGTELLARNPLPLFTLTLRDSQTKQDTQVTAERGWEHVDLEKTEGGLAVQWRAPEDAAAKGIEVRLEGASDPAVSAVRWKLRVANESRSASLWRVVFPQVAAAEPGGDGSVLFPRGPGEVERGPWRRPFQYQGLYPGGWTTMQFLAFYDEKETTGLYFALHDPKASAKDIKVVSRPEEGALVLAFDHPTADMGRAGNDFVLSGEAVWQLLRGDWFDAAKIYRAWARKEASWFPTLGTDGRADTPGWMKELCLWALTGGAAEGCVPQVEKFAQFMGVPAGYHWYNWHRIPFDNDYPHYFPAKEGFKEGVERLQKRAVYVMPYINGRLWDTRDRESEDFEFSRVARPAAAKNEKGEPYTETYGSKEKDGSPVRLAAMCPTTELWQKTVRGIVLRLVNDVGLNAVYIDQIAAASPRLCFDPDHGHALGGGHWWVDGYRELLEAIHRDLPEDRVLTTECNAEPYLRWFDGYLTWHWQHDGQVPAFPAVYGGAIQMFGRAYRGGATRDLALRMKAGQQLVFGEQIGWIHPGVAGERENGEFLRQVVRLRHGLRRYFYAGEMARPPRLLGDIPEVRADWQWSGEWWVSTPAVLSGAWRLPREGKLALLFVNVSDQPVKASFRFDGSEYGVRRDRVQVRVLRAEEVGDGFPASRVFERALDFPPRQAWAWEVE